MFAVSWVPMPCARRRQFYAFVPARSGLGVDGPSALNADFVAPTGCSACLLRFGLQPSRPSLARRCDRRIMPSVQRVTSISP